MKRDNSPWQPLAAARLDWSDDGAPRSRQFEDVYFSRAGGLEEGQYVFLEGNGLPRRWSEHPLANFCIVETGFGTGLNFLLTWSSWRRHAPSVPRLHYISIEKHPLRKEDLVRALGLWPELADQSAQLLDHYPDPIPGQHRIVLEDGAILLDLWWEDAAAALPDIASGEQRPVDAWYLDGFAPARNESLWNDRLYSAMAAASHPGTTFATYTAAGEVRRGLSAAGFEVAKVSGFGPKRECLRGHVATETAPLKPASTPWDIAKASRPRPSSALIIGAGLAGCTAAAALAQRGIQVTLLERERVACGGSGNNQGMLYTRLSPKHSRLSDFAIQSFCFAHRFYRELLRSGALREGEDGSLCGSFHQSHRQEEMSVLAQALQSVPNLARVLDADAASELLGIRQDSGGYWFPNSGWMRPASVCRALIGHPNIALKEDTGAVELHPDSGGWVARSAGEVLAQADCAIIATGTAANESTALCWLPLQAIRGQTTELPTDPALAQLRAGFCHTGYISPARNGQHCIGATFDIGDEDFELRPRDHRRNLDALAAAIPLWKPTLDAIDASSLSGRVSYRCATPDYLPQVGPVPDRAAFLQTYGALRKNARQTIPQQGSYMPGLYVTTGHGSRGLTSTPLAAQALASQICGEAAPLSRELTRAIAPARFLIRRLQRGQL